MNQKPKIPKAKKPRTKKAHKIKSSLISDQKSTGSSFDPKEIGIDDLCSEYDDIYDRCGCRGNYGGDPASQGE